VKIDKAWDNYQARTARLGDVVRQLAFAGIALLWVFSNGETAPRGPIHLPGDLRGPAAALIATLIFDILGQVVGVVGVRIVTGRAEDRRDALPADQQTDFEFKYPDWFPWIGETTLALKVIALLVAYIWLGITLGTRWI